MTIDRVIRRRILLGFLVAASFGLLTAWYREANEGPLHRAQGSVADAAVPSPRRCTAFRGRSGTSGTGAAASPTRVTRYVACRRSISGRRSSWRAIQQELADETDYRTLLGFTKNPRFSRLLNGFTPVGADVIERPVEPDTVRVLLDSGSANGIAKGDAVVVGIDRDRAALVGIVERANDNSSVVTLITSPDFAIGASVRRRRPTAWCGRAATRARSSSTMCRSATPSRSATSS